MISVAARSVAARLLGLRVRILPEVCISVSCDYCVLSGRRLCDGLITRPKEFYCARARASVCVCVCHCVFSGTTVTIYIHNE